MAEFDYIWDIVRSGEFQQSAKKRETILHWLAQYIASDGDRAEWVTTPGLSIKKASLTLVAKFFQLLVRNRVSPTKADNALTLDRSMMVVAFIARFEINFARMLLDEIHERAFRSTTTLPFPCMIFQLCRDDGVPIWHCDKLVQATGTLDISFIQDEANVAAPQRSP